MTILDRQMGQLAKSLAYTARFSARRPIHVILITLLLSAVAYLSVVQYYVSGWQLSSASIFSADSPDAESLFDECSHYYRDSNSDIWTLLSSDEARSKSPPQHYYLFNLDFERQNNSIPLPTPDGVIYELKNNKYVLKSEPEIEQCLTSKDGTQWRTSNYRNRLFEVQHLACTLYNNLRTKLFESEPFDIIIVGSAHLTMFYSVLGLFNSMSKTGSKFWLSLSAIVNSACALFLALYTTQSLVKRPVSLISLVEGLPFIAVIVGFRHKVRLAAYTLQSFDKIGISKKMTTDKAIFDAMCIEGRRLLQDHMLCIVAFVGCSIYARQLETLTNFCILSTFILIFELLLTTTFFSAVLALKLEINVIHRSTIIKQTLEEDGVVPKTADIVSGAETSSKTSVLQSNSAVTLIKLSLVGLFVAVNFYNFGTRWASDTFSSIYTTAGATTLPEFIKSHDNGNLGEIIISVAPIQFYRPMKAYHQFEDTMLSLLRYVSVAIRDRFISKLVFFALAISAAINIYLLNAARIHTRFTADEVTKKAAIKKEQKISLIKQSEPARKAISTVSKSSSLSLVSSSTTDEEETDSDESFPGRPLEELEQIYKNGNVCSLKNKEIVSLVTNGVLPLYALEKKLGDTTRAVAIRRKAISVLADAPVLSTERLPYKFYDYDRVFGACCENVIGYMPLPVGVIGPLFIDGVSYHIPMATTEGCLVASAMRGCKAINAGGGATTVITKDGMTRGPCVRFPTLARAGACKIWLDSEEGQNKVKKAFNSTSRFARLQHIQTALAGDLLFVRFRTTTGDAMGMNMISKGVEFSLKQMVEEFGWDDMEIVSVSGNYCTDKKSAAINWIEGRGKSVVAEATIPGDVVRNVLKSDVSALVELNISKNLIGSALAGSIGGFNAHAANLVTAVFLALGQDPAQNVESSNCMTLMKEVNGDLRISVSMPSIEVGTIGGGTILEPQGAMLDLLGVRGPHPTDPGANSRQLAKIVACAVMAGELSLCAALAAGHLVQSHMTHNRAKKPENVASLADPKEIERLKEGAKSCIKS
ncbi:hypothetical protein HG536_0C06050 [Torulaspora globosa]|uniref:3-hydroxy-3-methylglutaryl coenzyme A reductase n=1 Tax=Torulaspora globosa TaxID=48254 RepID=A0A7G3ZG00_9SACH|nr:uncharacterized protein HG536_0C06050 [Torulaspora globosa]QLL32436.1 hypothetical protein HG536_0C06050 [Torulaspora globosa]